MTKLSKMIAGQFSPFYDHGRRFVGVSPKQADKWIAEHATASLADGVVTIRQADGTEVPFAVGKHLHRADVANWVRTFNKRSNAPAA